MDAFISVTRDVDNFENDMRRDAKQFGRTLKDLIEDVRKANGEQRAMQLLEEANDEERLVSVRWVWLDEEANENYRPRVPRSSLTTVLKGESVTLPLQDQAGHEFLYRYEPLELAGSRPAALEFGKSLDILDTFRHNAVTRSLLLAVGFILGGVLIVSVLGVTLIGRPLNQLIEKTRRVGAGDLSGPVAIQGRDELTELAAAFNQMCDQLRDAHDRVALETEARIAALEQLRHAGRLATVGRLASGVAHELGTPMNVISARATMILEDDEVDDSARIIKTQIEKMIAIIRQLLDSARPSQTYKLLHDVCGLVSQVASMLAPLAMKRNIQVRVSSDEEGISTILDGGQFQQVVTNLLVNAIHAMPDGGLVDINVRAVQTQPPDEPNGVPHDYIRVDVRDSGEGIDEAHLNQLFDPFFTTKDIGEGIGLGLSIAYGIVREHGGWIDVESEQGEGSCFSLHLPREEEAC